MEAVARLNWTRTLSECTGIFWWYSSMVWLQMTHRKSRQDEKNERDDGCSEARSESGHGEVGESTPP